MLYYIYIIDARRAGTILSQTKQIEERFLWN